MTADEKPPPRKDGLVDGGTIQHLEELRASRRALDDLTRPWRRS